MPLLVCCSSFGPSSPDCCETLAARYAAVGVEAAVYPCRVPYLSPNPHSTAPITSTPSTPCHRVAKTPTSQVLAYPAGCGSQLALARNVTTRTALRTQLTPPSFRGGGQNRGRAAIGWRRNDPLLKDPDSSPDDDDTRQLRPSQGQHQGGTEEPMFSPLHHSDQDAAVELGA